MPATSTRPIARRSATPLAFIAILGCAALPSCAVRVRPPAPPRLPSAAVDPSAAVVVPSTLDFEVIAPSTAARDLLIGAANRGLVDAMFGASMTEEDRRAVAAAWPAPAPGAGPPSDQAEQGAEPGGDDGPPANSNTPPTPAPGVEPPPPDPPPPREDPARPGVHPALPRIDQASSEPAWRDADGIGVRAALHATSLAVTADGDRWVVTLSFESAIQASRASDGTGPKTVCGCDGADWCGGRARPLVPGKVTWSMTPTVGAGWRVIASPETTVTVDGTCAVPIPRSPSRDAARAVEALHAPDLARVAEVIADDLRAWGWVREASDQVWTALSTSSASVANGDTNGARVHLRPRGLAPASLDLQNGELRYALQARLRPYASTGAPPDPTPLPEPRELTAPSGFRAVGAVTVSPDELAAPLRARFVGRRIPDRPSNQVAITDVEVYGIADRLAIRFSFVGSATGEAFFVGALELDEDAAEVRLRDVRPTPETAAALAKLYDETETWSLQVAAVPWFDLPALSAEIGDVGRWSFAPAAATLRDRVAASLDGRRIGAFELAFTPTTDTTVLMVHDGDAVQVLRAIEGEGRARPAR